MKKFKKDLKPGEAFSSVFFLKSIEKKIDRNGAVFLKYSLWDKTGKINGYLWNDLPKAERTVRERSFAIVEGIPFLFGTKQVVKILRINGTNDGDVCYSDFGEVTPIGIDALMERFHFLVETIGDEYCRRLISLYEEDRAFMQSFVTVPAGKNIHHSYIGGLLEHTVGAMEKAVALAHESMNRDILLTGAFIHDSGKTRELVAFPRCDYTTEGSLLGHTAIGFMLLQQKIAQIPGFPEELGLLLAHMILSHHGNKPSNPVPSTPEAIDLAGADGMDARINHVLGEVSNTRDAQIWGLFDKILKTRVYVKPYHPGESIRDAA